MRFHSTTLLILLLTVTQHGSLALKGDSSALRLGAPRRLQVSMPPPKVPGTGTGVPNVPKTPPAQTTMGGNSSSTSAEGGGTLPQVGMGTVPKDKTTEKGAVAPGGSTFKADGAPMPKENKDKAPKDKNKDCKTPKNFVSSRRRTQVGSTNKVPPTGTAGTGTATTWTGANTGPAPGATVDKSIDKAPKVGTGTSPAMEPAIQPGSTTPEAQQFTPAEPEETATEGGAEFAPSHEGEQRFCLQSVVTEEQCAAVQGGELPTDSQKASGTLTMELSAYNTADPEAALEIASQILNAETPSKFIGCSQTFRKLQEGGEIAESTEEDGDVEPEREEPTYVTGLTFGEFKSTGDACEIQAAEDLGCDKIKADVDVYYQGKSASQEEIQEMFAMLTEIIQEQEASGSFADVGSVEAIRAEGGANGTFGTFGDDDGGDGGSSMGLAVGVAVGALVVVGLVGGIWYRSRKRRVVVAQRQGKNNNPETDDSSNE